MNRNRISEKNVEAAVQRLNERLPQYEVLFEHRHNYYALDYRPKKTNIVSGTIITCATKRECYDTAWAMMKAIELSQATKQTSERWVSFSLSPVEISIKDLEGGENKWQS